MDLSLWKYTTVQDAGAGRVVIIDDVVCLTMKNIPDDAGGRVPVVRLSGDKVGKVAFVGGEMCLRFSGEHAFEAEASAIIREPTRDAAWSHLGQLVISPEGVFVVATTSSYVYYVKADGTATEDLARHKRLIRNWHLGLRDPDGARIPFIDVQGRKDE